MAMCIYSQKHLETSIRCCYFCIPTSTSCQVCRSLQHADKTDFWDPWLQVVSEYRKARAIMADVAVEGATEGVWHNLFLEVDKVTFHRHTGASSARSFTTDVSCC